MTGSRAATLRGFLRPVRRRLRRVLNGAGRAPVVLMYHRVAAPRHDPWGLCVAPARFAAQLAALKAARTVVPLGELVEELEAGRPAPCAAAITFDDGYSDNALVAKPLLEEAGLPATIFLTSGFVGSGRAFWWDELADLVLGSETAADFAVAIDGVELAASWPAPRPGANRARPWRAWEPPTEPRQAAYRLLWNTLQPMPPERRERAMDRLRTCLPRNDGPTPEDLPMTAAMAAALASPRISVGGHGRTHVPLTELPVAEREAEIAGGRADLAALTGGAAPEGFAYPHGRWDEATRDIVARSGYRWAVTTRGAAVDPRRHDRYALPRMAVGDWDPARLLKAIKHLEL